MNQGGSFEVDNQEAMKIGDLEKNSEAIKVVRPKRNLLDPRRRGRTDAATGRGRNAAHLHQHRQCGVGRWRQPLVDEDWHAVCQATKASMEWMGKTCTASLWRRTRKSIFVTQVDAARETHFEK